MNVTNTRLAPHLKTLILGMPLPWVLPYAYNVRNLAHILSFLQQHGMVAIAGYVTLCYDLWPCHICVWCTCLRLWYICKIYGCHYLLGKASSEGPHMYV